MYESKKLRKQQIVSEDLNKEQHDKKIIQNSNKDFFRQDSQTCGQKMKRKFNELTDKAANFLECTRLFSVEKLDQLRNQSGVQQLQNESPHTIKSEYSFAEDNNSKIDTKAATKDGISQKYKVPPEDLEELPIKNYSLNQPLKFTKRYAQTYEESYSDRKQKFGYTYEYIQKERLKQYEIKSKTCWGQFKRLLFCQGGNYIEDLDQKQVETAVSMTKSIANKKSREPSLSNNNNRSQNVFYQQTKQQHEDLEEIKLDRSGGNNRKLNQNLEMEKQPVVKVRKQFQTKNEHSYEHKQIVGQVLRQGNNQLNNEHRLTDSQYQKQAGKETGSAYKQGSRHARKKSRNVGLVRQKIQTQPSTNTYKGEEGTKHKKMGSDMQIIHNKRVAQEQHIPEYRLQDRNTATLYNPQSQPNANTNANAGMVEQNELKQYQQNGGSKDRHHNSNTNMDVDRQYSNNNKNTNIDDGGYDNMNVNKNMNGGEDGRAYGGVVDSYDGQYNADSMSKGGNHDSGQYVDHNTNGGTNNEHMHNRSQGYDNTDDQHGVNTHDYNRDHDTTYPNNNNNNNNNMNSYSKTNQNHIFYQDDHNEDHEQQHNQQQNYENNQYNNQYNDNQYDNQYNNQYNDNQYDKQYDKQYVGNRYDNNQQPYNNSNMVVTSSYDEHAQHNNDYNLYGNADNRYSMQEGQEFNVDNTRSLNTSGLKRNKKSRKPTSIKVNEQEPNNQDIVLEEDDRQQSSNVEPKPELAKKKKNRRQPGLVIIKEKDDAEVIDLDLEEL